MSEPKKDFQFAYEAGLSAAFNVKHIEGVPHALVPPDCNLKSLEQLMPTPTRIRQHPQFSDIAGFANYVEEFKQVGSRVFVDDSNFRFVTIFDFHAPGLPAWCDHSASIKMELAPEWIRFCQKDGQSMRPRDFAEFLEDNVAYIDAEASGMTAADLLTMAQTFKVDVRGEIQTEETLQKGLRKLIIKDDSTLKGKNADGIMLDFPEHLHFSLRIFKNHKAYPIKVFLRTRTSKEQVAFMIKIPDAEGLREEAFERVITDVREATKLTVLKGTFDGPNHRK